MQYLIADDFNKLELVRRYQPHTHTVTGVIYSPSDKQLFSCSRDKQVIWHSVESGLKIGLPVFGDLVVIVMFRHLHRGFSLHDYEIRSDHEFCVCRRLFRFGLCSSYCGQHCTIG
jgi:WD40 repeat protein